MMFVRVSVAVTVAPGTPPPAIVPDATDQSANRHLRGGVDWCEQNPEHSECRDNAHREACTCHRSSPCGIDMATLAHRADSALRSAPIRRSGQRHSFFCTGQYRGEPAP